MKNHVYIANFENQRKEFKIILIFSHIETITESY